MAKEDSYLEGQMSQTTLKVYRALPSGGGNRIAIMNAADATGLKRQVTAQCIRRLCKLGAIKRTLKNGQAEYEVP